MAFRDNNGYRHLQGRIRRLYHELTSRSNLGFEPRGLRKLIPKRMKE